MLSLLWYCFASFPTRYQAQPMLCLALCVVSRHFIQSLTKYFRDIDETKWFYNNSSEIHNMPCGVGKLSKRRKKNLSRTSRHYNYYKGTRKLRKDISEVHIPCILFKIHEKHYFLWLQQPSWRLWGEEKVEGAIFNIYLKKVRYHRPAKSISSVSMGCKISSDTETTLLVYWKRNHFVHVVW